MQRGEVWWARLPAPIGERPVVLLSREDAYDRRASVTVGPISTKVRRLKVEVRVGRPEGLRQDSVVNLDDIQTVHKSAIFKRKGRLSPAKMREVEDAIRFALDLPRYER